MGCLKDFLFQVSKFLFLLFFGLLGIVKIFVYLSVPFDMSDWKNLAIIIVYSITIFFNYFTVLILFL